MNKCKICDSEIADGFSLCPDCEEDQEIKSMEEGAGKENLNESM